MIARAMAGNVVIIGGGVGGLAAAIRLASQGVRVTLLEKNERVGGKLNLWEVPHPVRPNERPFRFDTGPSLLTLPFIFADLFEAAGEDVRDWLPITKLDPIASFRWADGMRLDLRANLEDTLSQVRQISTGDVEGWQQLFARGRKIWDLSAEVFLFHAPEQVLRGLPGESFNPFRALGMITTPLRIGMFANFARTIDKHLKHPKLREVMYQYATYSGASPFKAPATLAVIPFTESYFGGWYPDGGMYQIASKLEELARKVGVEVRTNCAVRKINVESYHPTWTGPWTPQAPALRKWKQRVWNVELADGTELPCEAVIANSDVVYTYRELIDDWALPHWPQSKLNILEPGGSGMVLLLGVEGTYPQLSHHTKFMPADYRSDLRAMFETRTVPEDPCIYVCASTRTDPTQAPEGCENIFVLCSAPPLDGKLDWSIEGSRYEEQILKTLEQRWGLTDLRKRIVVKRRMTPVDLQSLYNANAGSIYGIGSNSRRAAFLRPPNRDKKIKNLYFAGGATHPGGGLPLVALSGKIAAEMVMEDLG